MSDWLCPRAPTSPGSTAESGTFPADPIVFFLDQARVALGDGARFGAGGDGFVRLNFGCPRSILADGLDRMAAALEARGA